MPKKKTIKPRRGYAVVCENNGLQPIGNGDEFQYPVFYSKGDAVNFLNRPHGCLKPRIIQVRITPLTPKKK